MGLEAWGLGPEAWALGLEAWGEGLGAWGLGPGASRVSRELPSCGQNSAVIGRATLNNVGTINDEIDKPMVRSLSRVATTRLGVSRRGC